MISSYKLLSFYYSRHLPGEYGMSHWVRPHFRGGRWTRGHRRRNPGSRSGGRGPGNGGNVVGIVIVIGAVLAVVASCLAGIGPLRSKAKPPARPQSITNALAREAQAGFKRAEAALKANRLQTRLSTRFDTDCAAHSEGQLHDHFQGSPCKYLARAYIEVGKTKRDPMLVAIAWIEMPDVASAAELKQLVDMDVGNVIELSRETKPYRNVSYEERIYAAGMKGTFVWSVEVKPLTASTPESLVNRVIDSSRQQ
jgi:hypothetical protein